LVRARSRRYWHASALIALLLALTGGTVLAAVDGARRTSTALDRLLALTRPANGFLQLQGLNDQQAAQLRAMPEIEASATLQAMAISPAVRGDTYIPVGAAMDTHWGREVERPHIVRGRAPRVDAPLEIVLGEVRASLFGADVGSVLPMTSY